MKPIALAILAFAVVFASLYFVISFVVWDANPKNWAEVIRFLFAWCGLSLGGLAASAIFAQTYKH